MTDQHRSQRPRRVECTQPPSIVAFQIGPHDCVSVQVRTCNSAFISHQAQLLAYIVVTATTTACGMQLAAGSTSTGNHKWCVGLTSIFIDHACRMHLQIECSSGLSKSKRSTLGGPHRPHDRLTTIASAYRLVLRPLLQHTVCYTATTTNIAYASTGTIQLRPASVTAVLLRGIPASSLVV